MDSQKVKSVDQLRIEMFIHDFPHILQEFCRFIFFVAMVLLNILGVTITILLDILCLIITFFRLDTACVALWTWIVVPLWAWTFVLLWAWTFAPLLTWIHHSKAAKITRSTCKFLSRHVTFSRVYYGLPTLAVSTSKFGTFVHANVSPSVE
jgi:hypothetical protein